jgi:hypothetical protein
MTKRDEFERALTLLRAAGFTVPEAPKHAAPGECRIQVSLPHPERKDVEVALFVIDPEAFLLCDHDYGLFIPNVTCPKCLAVLR